MHLSVALKSEDEPQVLPFSRSWTAPTTVLHLSSGRLALQNVTFLVTDDELACEDMLIGNPVLKHLGIDTRTLSENNHATFDGIDCSGVVNLSTASVGDAVNRMMIARHHRVQEGENTDSVVALADRPRVNYYSVRKAEDPFPDPSLLDPLDEEQHEDVRQAVENLQKTARENGLDSRSAKALDKLVETHVDVFSTSFSAGPPARIKPLKIELTPDAKPVKVRLRKYSQEQRDFLSKFVADLSRTGMVYLNPTSAWACAPPFGPETWTCPFSVYCRPPPGEQIL